MPSRSALRLNQRRSPEKWNQGAANRMLDAIAPRGLEVRNSADRGQNIDSMRRQPELNHDIRSPQVIERDSEIVERCAKFGKRAPYAVGVVIINTDPDVDVLRAPRYTVYSHRVRADYQESGAGLQQRLEKFAPIFGHRRRITRPGISFRL